MIQTPFLITAVFAGWVLPQLLGLSVNDWLPSGALDKTIVMATLCLLATWLGYQTNHRQAKLFSWQFNQKKLLASAAALTFLGAFFFHKVSQLAAEVNAATGGQWTGIITIYVFFASLLSYGTVIALILYLRTGSILAILVSIPGLVLYLERIVIRGRRAAMVELGLSLLLAFWFNRRILPPRWLMICTILIGTLVINSIGDYRSTMLSADRFSWSGAGFAQVMQIDFIGNLKSSIYGKKENHELRNAAMNIAAADDKLEFDFGFSLWNGFVHTYVPAQVLGSGFKEGIKVELGTDASHVYGHSAHIGSTVTGLSDAFQSFWYFGAIKFFLIGLIMSRWYKAAINGSLAAQLVVILSMNATLHTITHTTHHFFLNFVQLGIFLLPALWFAKKKHLHY